MNDEILEVLEEIPFQIVEALFEMSSHHEKRNEICCQEVREVWSQEISLAAQGQSYQQMVKEELQLPELDLEDDNNENLQ